MTILRRFFAVVLIIVLIPVFLAAVLVAQANATVLSPNFYVSQLQRADIFNYTYDKVLPAALDEAASDPDSPAVLKETEGKIITVAKTALPPDWLEQQSEAAIIQIVPYMTGQKDDFVIRVPLQDRVQALGTGVKDLVADPSVYAYIVDDAIAPQLEQALRDQGALPLGMKVQAKDLVDAFKEVAPQTWVASTAGQVIDQTIPFATGKSDTFTIIIPVQDRFEAAGPALKKILANSGAYSVLQKPDFTATIQKELDGLGQQPYGLKLTGAQVAQVVQQVAPPDWLKTQGDAAIDQLIPYLAGKKDNLVIVIPLKDQLRAASPAIKKMLADSGSYQKIGDEIAKTIVAKNMSSPVSLPIGVKVTPEQVTQVLRDALPKEYVQQQGEALVDALAPYLAGDTATMRVTIPLDTPKKQALASLETIVTQQARTAYNALPPCTFVKAVDFLKQAASSSMPTCRPAGFTLQEIKQGLGLNDPRITENDIAKLIGVDVNLLTKGVTFDQLVAMFGSTLHDQVASYLNTSIPATFVYTDADLRATLSKDGSDKLNKVLEWGRNGYTLTDADLRKMLGPDGAESLDNIRAWSKKGFTYSNKDLEAILTEDDPEEGLQTYNQVLDYTRNGLRFSQADLIDGMSGPDSDMSPADLDDIRHTIGKVRDFQWLVYLIPVLMLLAIGFLAGRDLRSRLAWGSSALGVAAAVAVALFGIVYNFFVWPMVRDQLAQSVSESTGAGKLMMEKAQEVVPSVSDAIVGGMMRLSVVFLVLGIAGVVFAAFLPRIQKAMYARSQKAQA